jgi:hypothetical protein
VGDFLAAAYATQEPPVADPTDQDLDAFGWAPGRYSITCRDCGGQPWDCAKRSRRCRECAVEAFHAEQADAATPLGAKRRQVAAQCKAVAHPGSRHRQRPPGLRTHRRARCLR